MKYLREAQFDGILGELFLTEANKKGAILCSKRIDVSSLSISKIKRLRECIKKLKSVNWKSK